jgi:hypothetical protein
MLPLVETLLAKNKILHSSVASRKEKKKLVYF